MTSSNFRAATTNDRIAWTGIIAGAIVGLVVGLQALDSQFIAGTGGKWIRPENDYNAYLVAWNYYVRDIWRLPLFSLPQMGYPEGGSVLFNDALPFTALPTKILYRSTGILVNPFGWWILFGYVSQGAAAARLVQAVGVRSIWALLSAAALAVVSIAFVARTGHTSLSTHCLLLWAIALHFASLRQGRALWLESAALLTVTLLINAYLFAMIFPIVGLTFLALALEHRLQKGDAVRAALVLLSIVAVGLVAGYGLVFSHPTTMKSEGFGKYSWNVATLLLPPEGLWRGWPAVLRDATHGQYEGEAFIGRGALLLLAAASVLVPLRALAAAQRYWILIAALVGFAIYAASNQVYAGSILLVSVDLPSPLVDLGNYFRATGRFIWPLSYCLMLLPLAALFRWCNRPLAMALAALAVVLQVTDAEPGLRYRRVQTTQAYKDLIDAPRVAAWMSEHQRVWQYPSWDCGGLVGANRRWPSDDTNRELQLQLAASRVGVPMNSIYMSRAFKNCAVEAAWGQAPSLEPGVLYILGRPAVDASPQLTSLAQSPACVAVEWATVCSEKFEPSAPK